MNGVRVDRTGFLSIERRINSYAELLDLDDDGRRMFASCFWSTLDTTVERVGDGEFFVVTGDIPAMWLRDSAAQVAHYVRFAGEEPAIRDLISGVVRRQVRYVLADPYANAFNREPNGNGHHEDLTESSPLVWERKYEIDSLCYPIWLAHTFWKATGETDHIGAEFRAMVDRVVKVWRIEQHHEERSPYRFIRTEGPPSDTLECDGRGAPVAYTGMTWSGFRPSDDACTFGFNIPGNIFAATALSRAAEMLRSVLHDPDLAQDISALRDDILRGVAEHGIVQHPVHGAIYAYETDGKGNHLLMDDANVPSLLSLPFLGCLGADDPLYRNTRNFILSGDNPYWYSGSCASGVGSPHTPKGYIWHIGLIVQALTSRDESEVDHLLRMIRSSTAGTDQMHESFDPEDPSRFTRAWFAWANSLYAELVLTLAERKLAMKNRRCGTNAVSDIRKTM